ncbi:hypothetical protein P4O66_022981, partial [Electrophorus voltai]
IKDEMWLFLIPAVLAVLLLALFLEEIGFFLRHEPSSRRSRLCLWILGMYPVFGMTSIVALYVPRSSSLCNFIASLYHSITLLKFMGLITNFFGGKAQMFEVLAGKQVSPNPFPCCCCCCLPLININRTSLGWMMAAVLQLSVVRTLLFFITLVLWTDEQYDYGDSGILETMGALKVVPCTPPFSDLFRSQLIYHYSVIVEMFCISPFARNIFRKVEPSPDGTFGMEKGIPSSTSKAVQTEAEPPLAVQLSTQAEDPWCSNPACSRDSDDSLCRIEHAPLDRFPFPLQTGPPERANPERDSTTLTREHKSRELPTITVSAEINCVENTDVTVV